MRSKYTLYILFSLLLLFFCSKSDETYTIEIKNGVKYVHNQAPLWGDEPKISLEFVQKIGDLETLDENYQLYRPNDVVRDANENLYILDTGNYRIQKYDKNGSYLATIGRKGNGPGEFIFPVRLEIDSKENLYIGDPGQNRVLVLTIDGKEIKRINILRGVEQVRVNAKGNIITPTFPRKNRIPKYGLFSLFDVKGNLIKEFGEPKDLGDNMMTLSGNEFFMSLDISENIYVTFYKQNRIEKYSSEGNLIFRADRPLNYKVGPNKRESERFVSFNSFSGGVGNDHKNRIWVLTYKKQPEEDEKEVDYMEFEIFNNDGILLGKLSMTHNVELMRILQDRVYFIDGHEEMCVYEYKIVDK